MKIRGKAAFDFILLGLMLILTGCGGMASARTASSAAGPENERRADRYAELIRPPETGKLSIYFLDLSVSPQQTKDRSGDASLLISPDGKVMLLDAGHPESAPDILAFLKDLGIDRIDYFVSSHPHIDHIGDLTAILEKHPIGQVYRTNLKYTTTAFRRNNQILEARNIPVTFLKKGDTLRFGDLVEMEVFNPETVAEYPPDYPTNAFVNNSSLTIKFTYGKSTLLMAGDIYTSREWELLDEFGERLRSDVLKINHHGGETSNSARWINEVNPKIAAAMDDVLLSMPVYKKYRSNNTAFYHTVLDGIIRVTMDDNAAYTVTTRFESWLRD